MSLFSFNRERRNTQRSARGTRAFVPRLEVLESRDLLSTFTVINTSSDANTSGSLPWAVQQANGAPGANTINFNIPGSGTQIIHINSTLSLTNQVIIDGTSQPGYNGTPLISVQGNPNVQTLFFLDYGVDSSGSTIQSLDMYDYNGAAVEIAYPSSGNRIQNNWIGFFHDPVSGQVLLNSNLGQINFSSGVEIMGANNNVIRNNVIDGTNTGILVTGFGGSPGNPPVTPSVNNSIVENFIGTDPSGTTAAGYGNQGDGISLGQASENTQITGNVLSGNTGNGIKMQLDNAHMRYIFPGYNVISENKIGTDVSGNFAIPNGTGITISGVSAHNTISNNLISGNLNTGIVLGVVFYAPFGPGNSNWIQGNIIGLNASQTAAISPGDYGIFFTNGSTGNQVQGNVIAGAKFAGVISDANTSGNSLIGNWIGESASGQSFPNGYYGVELFSGSWYNSVLQNAFGPNGAGSVYVAPNTNWNSIGYTPQPTPSSLGAQIQMMVNYYVLMVQQLALNNPSGFFDALQGYTYFVGILQMQIFNSLLRGSGAG